MSNNVNAILEGLNSEQRKAVECVEGPVLIVAGAGSGKTRVLTSRVAYLLEKGCEPDRILALTFTRKAAGEMKERIALMVGAKSARRVVMGTFHSVFIRFLRKYADLIGYPPAFTVYDTSDSVSVIKTCLKELGLDDKLYKPKEILSRISMAKNNLITADKYRLTPELTTQDLRGKKPRISDIYVLYQDKLKKAGVMDFDDILLNMNILLRDHEQALQDISERFSHIMVDEYQDTNFAQYIILKRLALPHRNICVVGDDSQSIYAFRGAKIENILKFRNDYPESRLIRLEKNYRSTRTIVDAANSVISHNENRIPKTCYADGEQGEKIGVIKAFTEQEEAILVISDIMDRIRRERAQYQDFAILYRTNAQSRVLEEQLRRKNIPYMIYSGNSFFERAEIKDMMAYFKLVANINDDESFKRIVNKPARGIGDTTLEGLKHAADALHTSLFKAIGEAELQRFGIKNTAETKLKAFSQMIYSLADKAVTMDADEIAKLIADQSGLYDYYKADTSVEGMSKTANVEELLNSVASFMEERAEQAEDGEPADVTLGAFLENISLLSNVDVESDEDSANKVSLMTVHSAKGLEYPFVYICGMEENLFPSLSMLSSVKDVEEERRLFYVALTRAQKAASISFASSRMRNGKHEYNSPSRFVKEIDGSFLARPIDDEDDDSSVTSFSFGSGGNWSFGKRKFPPYGSNRFPDDRVQRTPPVSPVRQAQPARPAPTAPSRAPKPAVIDPEFKPSPVQDLQKGCRVEHERFGGGTILDISGSWPRTKAEIDFDDYGVKTILLKYAKLRLER